MHDERTANLLGATALSVSDLLLADVTAAAGTSVSGAAALAVLSRTPGLSVTELGRRVGLSQPAAARMVDSLQSRGLVQRRPTALRSVALVPTAAGKRHARRGLAARTDRLSTLVGRLSEADRAALERLLGLVLEEVYGEVGSADLVCRLCDRTACVATEDPCPIGQAERDHTTTTR